MFYTVYKTTNKINGKFYIGTHKTENLNDSYMGSGKILKSAIKKNGIENFEKEILFVFDNSEDMFSKEAEIVTEDFLAEHNTYNLKIGGFGGFDYINTNKLGWFKDNTNAKFAKKRSDTAMVIKYGDNFHAIITAHARKYAFTPDAKLKTTKTKIKNGTYGKNEQTTTAECISKRRETYKQTKHQQGNKNSNFGNCWVYHEAHGCKLVQKGTIAEYINNGWVKGRNKTTKQSFCKCNNKKNITASFCASCLHQRRIRFSDDEIKLAWVGCTKVVDVARKLGYNNPNNIGSAFNRIKNLKP